MSFSRSPHFVAGAAPRWRSITPETTAAVSKLMRVQGLALVARKCRVVSSFDPVLVNTVVGLVVPGYLYDGKQ